MKLGNERKVEVLSLLSNGDSWTASEVAEALGLRLSNASELLRRYHRDSLVVRRRLRGPEAPPRAYDYRLTEKGAERLDWLSNETWEVEYE
ncbi:MAG: hypothetical protein ACE5JL_10415 [Dehalococcoidia bacterium]